MSLLFNEMIKLIEIPINITLEEEVKTRETLRRTLGQLTVKVNYQDIYDTKMPLKEIELFHFLRTDNVN